MEDLLAKHRKEARDLQAKITQKKKSATKKTRKGVNDECDRLQSELSERHQAEIAQLNGEPDQSVVDSLDDMNLDGVIDSKQSKSKQSEDITEMNDTLKPPSSSQTTAATESQTTAAARTKKPNRHKARKERRAAEQAAMAEAAAEEAAKQPDRRGTEREVMNAEFEQRNLREIEIQPDGHCLFSAVAVQLEALGAGLKPDPSRIVLDTSTLARIDGVTSAQHDGYRAVRAVTADYLTANRDDFEGFIDEPFDAYTRKIKLTGEWGGHVELMAMARAYGVNINIIRAGQGVEEISWEDNTPKVNGETDDEKAIWLAYYHHTYGLGEHYNALMKRS